MAARKRRQAAYYARLAARAASRRAPSFQARERARGCFFGFGVYFGSFRTVLNRRFHGLDTHPQQSRPDNVSECHNVPVKMSDFRRVFGWTHALSGRANMIQSGHWRFLHGHDRFWHKADMPYAERDRSPNHVTELPRSVIVTVMVSSCL
jgi:hypothetical protein